MSPEIEKFLRSLLPKSSEPASSSFSWTHVPQAQPPSGKRNLQYKAPAKPDDELPAMRNAAGLAETSQPKPGEGTAQTLRKSPDFSAMSQMQPKPAAATRDRSTDQRSDKSPKADAKPGEFGASAPGGDKLLTSTSGNSKSTTNSQKKKSWLRIF
jgi:hypothetical protein